MDILDRIVMVAILICGIILTYGIEVQINETNKIIQAVDAKCNSHITREK